MDTETDYPLVPWSRSIASVASVLAIIVGGLVLIGWALDLTVLKSVFPGLVPMRANAAMGVILAGVSLWCLREEPAGVSPYPWRIGQAAALVTAALGALTLSEYFWGWDLGIDQILFQERDLFPGTSQPGQMAPQAALSLLLIGIALSLLDVKTRPEFHPSRLLILPVILVGLLALMGYLYQLSNLYDLASNPMALNATVTFLALGVGILAARPNTGFMKLYLGRDARGLLLRRYLLLAILLPLVSGWLALGGQRLDLYGDNLSHLLLTVTSIALLCFLVNLAIGQLTAGETRLRPLSSAIEQSADLILITSPDGTIQYVNTAFEQHTGYSREEALGKTPRILKSGVQPPEFYKELWSTILAGKLWTGSFVNRKKDGAFYETETSIAPIRSDQGTITHFVSVEKDVTERQRSEKEKQRLVAILEATPDLVAMADASGGVLYMNPGGRKMLGVDEWEDVQGTSPGDYYPEWAVERLTGEIFPAAVRDGVWSGECAFLHRDGHEVPVWMVLLAHKSATGEVAFSTISRDITERKRAEETLRESEQRFRVMFESSADAVMLLGESGFLDCNDATLEMFGCSRSELLSKHPSEVSPPIQPDGKDSRTAADERIAVALREGRNFFAWTHRRANGEDFPAEVLLSTLTLRGKQILQATVRDISDRKALEAQLLQSQKLETVGTLAGGIAHDFNNILTVVIGQSDQVLDRLSPDDALRSKMETIRRSATRAGALTRSLLAFSRRQVFQPTPLDLNAVVSDMQEMLGKMVREDVRLGVECKSTGWILADPSQIGQVVMNLVANARDAMPEGGTVTIETADVVLGAEYTASHLNVAAGPYVRLSVTDTGVGMDEATRARAVEPFFTTKSTGSGLGLATVHGIVTQSRGQTWLYSEPGQGTTVKVYLPRVEAAETGRPARRSGVETEGLRGQETILVVEDHEDILMFVQEALEGWGYSVLAASDGPTACTLAADHDGTIDLLLTDIVMPGMSGVEVARRLAASQPGIRTLFTSGYTQGETLPLGTRGKHGPAFLEKPFCKLDLGRKIRAVLDEPTGR